MAIIPSTNLPVYLQRYTVSISDGEVSWALLSADPSNMSLKRVWSFQLNGTLSHTTRDTYTIEYNLDNVDNGGYVISFEGQPIGSLILSNSLFVVNEKNLTFTYVDTPTQKRIVLQLDARICPVNEGRTREFLLNFYLNDTTQQCQTNPYPSIPIDFGETSSQSGTYTYTAPTSPSTEGILQFTNACPYICNVKNLNPLTTDFISVTETTNQVNMTTPSSTLCVGVVNVPTYFFNSIYGCSQQIGSETYFGQIDYYTKNALNAIVSVSSQLSSITSLVLSYTNFSMINFNLSNNPILPVGIATTFRTLRSVQFQVEIFDQTPTLSFFTALIDPSFLNSVMVLVPFPTSVSTPTTYTADIQTSTTSSGWYWTAPSVSTTSFYALIQDTVSSEFLTTACSNTQLCLTNSLDNTSVWYFVQSSPGVYTISSYALSSPTSTTYVTSSSQCAPAPCLLSTACSWTITVPSVTPTNTNPFITTISSSCSGSNEYIVVTTSGTTTTIAMSTSISTYNWNIIPVVIAAPLPT